MNLFKDEANKEELEVELQALGSQVSYINSKSDRISNFTGISINISNLNAFKEEIKKMNIDLSILGYLDTVLVCNIVSNINNQITNLLEMIIELKKQVANYNKFLSSR